jgi:hypothetical protein
MRCVEGDAPFIVICLGRGDRSANNECAHHDEYCMHILHGSAPLGTGLLTSVAAEFTPLWVGTPTVAVFDRDHRDRWVEHGLCFARRPCEDVDLSPRVA